MSVIKIDEQNFKKEVLESSTLVLVDFWASWCNPCKMVAPIVDEIAEERNDIKVCKINIDEQPQLANEFGVMSIPTLMVFKNGKPKNTKIGACTKSELIEMLTKTE